MPAKIVVVYDPYGGIKPPAREHMPRAARTASLDLPADLTEQAIAGAASRLAVLLLEQLLPPANDPISKE